MKRLLLVLSLLTLIEAGILAKIPESQFSSISTIRRELGLEKDKKHIERIKEIKKFYKGCGEYGGIKDVAIETWNDGVTYYVLYEKPKPDDKLFCIMPIDSTYAYFAYSNATVRNLRFFEEISLVEIHGKQFFYTKEGNLISHYFKNGINVSFNPDTDLKKYGDNYYVYITDSRIKYQPNQVYDTKGVRLSWGDAIEFFPAAEAGVHSLGNTGLALYHPDLDERFISTTDQSYLAHLNKPYSYGVNWSLNHAPFEIKVPGGYYLISDEFPKQNYITVETRTDPMGVTRKYNTFVSESRFNNCETLYLYKGNEIVKLLDFPVTKITLSSPDQIIYYTYCDDKLEMMRKGCKSLIDESLNIPPKFNDVIVIYNDNNEADVYVKLTYFSEWEKYSPEKNYTLDNIDYASLHFEKGNYDVVISKLNTNKADTISAYNLNRWVTAEIRSAVDKINKMNEDLDLIYNGKIPDYESDYTVIYNLKSNFFDGRTIDLAINAANQFAEKSEGNEKEHYHLMADYMTSLANNHKETQTRLDKIYRSYKADRVLADIQADAAAQRMRLESEQARANNNRQQQSALLDFIGYLFGVQRNAGNVVRPQQTSPTTVYTAGPRMIDQTSVSAELTGAAITSGWTPDYPTTATQSATQHSGSHSGNICHGCFSSGKCSVCNGQGRYAPNMDGKYIDCTACGKSGSCKQCGGTGYH